MTMELELRAFLSALGVNALSAWVVLLFLRWSCRLLPGPPRQHFVRRFFLAGFLTVPVLALTTLLWLPHYAPTTGLEWLDNLFFHVYSVALTEEGVKLGIFVYFARRWDSVREERDGMIQSASVALAFATAENYVYILRYGPQVMANRLFLTMAGHIAFSALAGRAWARARRNIHGLPSSSILDPALMAALPYLAMGTLVHGFYNFFITLDALPVSFMMTYLSFVLFLVLLKRTEETSPYRAFPLEYWRTAAGRLLRQARNDPFDWESRRKAAFYLIYGGQLEKAEEVLNDALGRCSWEPLLLASLSALRLLRGDEEARFSLKLALFEMNERRRSRFARALRRVLARNNRRSSVLKVIEESLISPAPLPIGGEAQRSFTKTS